MRTVSRWAEDLGARGLEANQLRYARTFGLGTGDHPVFPGMHEASALVAGATLAAARAVWSGAAEHGASIAGGMHHAMAAHASGFGVYNDPAIAIAWLLGHGAGRIAYVDIDAHHGDGVQAAFYADPRVLTISLHQHPATLFPFTGLPAETGGPGAGGSAVNVALPAGTGDAGWLRAFHAIVPPLLRQFGPQVLVSQHGCDTHRLDPLAGLELSIDAQRAAHAAIHALAHETSRRTLAVHRRRRLRTGPRRPADLDPPARRGRRPADPPRHADPRPLAPVRHPAHRPDRTRADDRRGTGPVRAIRVRLRPSRPRRPGDHGHPPGRLPPARAHAPAEDRDMCATARMAARQSTSLDRQAALARHHLRLPTPNLTALPMPRPCSATAVPDPNLQSSR